MVMNVMLPGGFEPKGRGLTSVKKVRLMHATVRYYLKHPKYNPQGWDVEKYGEPINQEEMAGTLMSFSALIMKGLEQMNVDLSKEEKDAYIHCWNIVGYFIGLDEDLYPTSAEDGWNLGVAIIKGNYEPSVESKSLTNALVDYSKSFFPNRWTKEIPAYFMGYFLQDVEKEIGKDISKELGIREKVNLFNIFIGLPI